MSVAARGLCLVAGLALFAAMQTAAAQVSSVPVAAGSRSECPVERHPIAIDPEVIKCHARFAPLQGVPPAINAGDPEHLEVLRTRGDALLRQLDRPEACGRSAKVRQLEACAILVYVIDEEFQQAGLPWTYVVKVYKTSHPSKERLRDTIVFTVHSNNSEGRYGPSAKDGEVWQLLAEQRVKTRCRPGVTNFVRESPGNPGSRVKPDTCRGMTELDVRYRPMLLLGRGEAEGVLSPASIKYNFGPAP